MSSSTKILMFVVGALLFTFLALFLTVPKAQAQGIVPPFPNAINLNPYYDVTTYGDFDDLEYFGISDIESVFGAEATPVSVFGSVNSNTTRVSRFKYDEIENEWNLYGSGTGGAWNFVFTDSTGTAFDIQYGLSPDVYIAQYKEIGYDDGIHMFINHGRGASSCISNTSTEINEYGIAENIFQCPSTYTVIKVENGIVSLLDTADPTPSLPDLSYRDSLSWVNIDIPEFNQMYLTEEIDLGVSYRLRGQNPYNMSQALCDSSMDYTLTVFARPANNAGATLVPIYIHGFNPSPVGEGASAVCTGTITAQNLDLSSFNFGYSSLMLNAVLSIGTPTPPLSSNLDFLVSSEDPIFINLNGINDYLDETGAETPLDTPPSSYEDCTTWDFSCQITNAFLFLFRPTISIQQRAMNLWNDLYPRTPIPYIEFVISDLVPVVRSLSSAESADDGSVNISFPTQEMFDWDEDIDVFSFSRETFTGEDSYFPPTVYNTFRLLIGLGIHLGGIMYLVTATRRFFAGLYS